MATYSEWKAKVASKQTQIGQHIPMITSDTYYYRQGKLKECGLLPWEIFWLVSHKTNTPGMKEMLEARKAAYLRAKEKRAYYDDYVHDVSARYKKEGWTFNNGNNNPFAMMAHYRDKVNADVTPTPKVSHKPKDFMKAKKKTEELNNKNVKPLKPWQIELEKNMFGGK